ncbi:hypothetical protein ACLOAV_000136 [Pseudogymnoascus australis]
MSTSTCSNPDLLAPPPRRHRSNATASLTRAPNSAAIINILAASPDWHYQGPTSPAANAGPAPAAGAGLGAGLFRGQAADAGQLGRAAGTQAAGGNYQATGAAAVAANNANPSRPATPTRVPTIIITTPGQHLHLPDSPTLSAPRVAPHQQLRKAELEHRIAELEHTILEMMDEAEAQEMVADRVWEELGMVRGRVQGLVREVERGGVLVAGLREMVGRLEGEGGVWRGRAVVAEGVLGVLGAWEGWEGGGEGGDEEEEEDDDDDDDDEEEEDEVFMECE